MTVRTMLEKAFDRKDDNRQDHDRGDKYEKD
jgi:hypothetical protein